MRIGMETSPTQTESLWRELHQRLGGFVRARVRSEHDADDVLQEIFLRIHSGAASVRNPASLTGWVFTLARNAITDHHRARARGSRQARTEQEAAPAIAAGDEGPDMQRQLAECMRPLVEMLPETYRDALIRTEFDGLTQEQAAAELGLSISGMKSRVQRARAMVREMLVDCCEIELDRRKGVVDYQRRRKGDDTSCRCDS